MRRWLDEKEGVGRRNCWPPGLAAAVVRVPTCCACRCCLPAGGHRSKQKSTVLSYTKCMPVDVGDQLLVKSIVNTALTVFPAAPHNASYVGGCHAGAEAAAAPLQSLLAGEQRSLARLLRVTRVRHSPPAAPPCRCCCCCCSVH